MQKTTFEIFELNECEWQNNEGEFLDAGIYYWPDMGGSKDPIGPFKDASDAIAHAQEDNYKLGNHKRLSTGRNLESTLVISFCTGYRECH